MIKTKIPNNVNVTSKTEKVYLIRCDFWAESEGRLVFCGVFVNIQN